MASLAVLLRLAALREPGPSPGFGREHLLLAFLTVGAAGTISRKDLARNSGLGEGSIRTVIKKLRSERYLVADTTGCHLTDSGRGLYESILEKISQFIPLNNSPLTIGDHQAAVLVRSAGGSVGIGIEQRDSAIRVGAAGATTYVIKGGRFTIPGGSSDCEKDFPSDAWSTLRSELKLRSGDALVVCGASDERKARLGALSAALTLL